MGAASRPVRLLYLPVPAGHHKRLQDKGGHHLEPAGADRRPRLYAVELPRGDEENELLDGVRKLAHHHRLRDGSDHSGLLHDGVRDRPQLELEGPHADGSIRSYTAALSSFKTK